MTSSRAFLCETDAEQTTITAHYRRAESLRPAIKCYRKEQVSFRDAYS